MRGDGGGLGCRGLGRGGGWCRRRGERRERGHLRWGSLLDFGETVPRPTHPTHYGPHQSISCWSAFPSTWSKTVILSPSAFTTGAGNLSAGKNAPFSKPPLPSQNR